MGREQPLLFCLLKKTPDAGDAGVTTEILHHRLGKKSAPTTKMLSGLLLNVSAPLIFLVFAASCRKLSCNVPQNSSPKPGVVMSVAKVHTCPFKQQGVRADGTVLAR